MAFENADGVRQMMDIEDRGLPQATLYEVWAAHSPELAVAVGAAQKARDVVRRDFKKLSVGNMSGVAAMEAEANGVAGEHIQHFFPEDKIFHDAVPDGVGFDAGRAWVSSMANGVAEALQQGRADVASIMVSLRDDFKTALAITQFPASGEWFHALHGKGAFLNGHRLGPFTQESAENRWVALQRYLEREMETPLFEKLVLHMSSRGNKRHPGLITAEPAASGLGVKMLGGKSNLVAVVRDANGHHPGLQNKAGDLLAMQKIVEEAGGAVVNTRGERIDPFVPEPMVIAINRAVAESILGALR